MGQLFSVLDATKSNVLFETCLYQVLFQCCIVIAPIALQKQVNDRTKRKDEINNSNNNNNNTDSHCYTNLVYFLKKLEQTLIENETKFVEFVDYFLQCIKNHVNSDDSDNIGRNISRFESFQHLLCQTFTIDCILYTIGKISHRLPKMRLLNMDLPQRCQSIASTPNTTNAVTCDNVALENRGEDDRRDSILLCCNDYEIKSKAVAMKLLAFENTDEKEMENNINEKSSVNCVALLKQLLGSLNEMITNDVSCILQIGLSGVRVLVKLLKSEIFAGEIMAILTKIMATLLDHQNEALEVIVPTTEVYTHVCLPFGCVL